MDAQKRTKQSIDMCLSILGNGNPDQGYALLVFIANRLVHARNKHPGFAVGAAHAQGVIGSEYQEFVHALEHEPVERQLDEACDVAVTCLRFLNQEHLEHA